MRKKDIRIRDPYIYTDKENGCYYMYGTTALYEPTLKAGNSFSCYKSYDLEEFEGPFEIFKGDESFWADRDFWAAELHVYEGKYYLFGSCKTEGHRRATHIFVSDKPNGRFVPVSDKPVTPEEWECLDGTFFVEDGKPYMVFCHEWKQVHDGEICAIELSSDLSRAVGEPKLLFRATDNPIMKNHNTPTGDYVTDGPFLWREGGKIKMIWSSVCNEQYLVLPAEADHLFGEWQHAGPMFDFSGGHAMVFYDLDGKRKISLHRPNIPLEERAFFYEF